MRLLRPIRPIGLIRWTVARNAPRSCSLAVNSYHVYGFHDLRRAFATVSADVLEPDALHNLMRHQSYQSMQRYINISCKLDRAVASLRVPEVLKTTAAG